MASDVILVIVVATALMFDFTNGFHDTANVVATAISTRAVPPRIAIGFASILNFAGAFISLAVAATVAKGIVDPDQIVGGQGMTIVFAGLIGAIAWNLATWWFGLPSSSSHALIGGLVGSTVAAAGTGAVDFNSLLSKVVIPALIAPILAFAVAGGAIFIIYRIVGRSRPGPVNRGYRLPPPPPPGRAAPGPAPSTAATGSASSPAAACSRSPTERTTRRRRWASSRSRSSLTARST